MRNSIQQEVGKIDFAEIALLYCQNVEHRHALSRAMKVETKEDCALKLAALKEPRVSTEIIKRIINRPGDKMAMVIRDSSAAGSATVAQGIAMASKITGIGKVAGIGPYNVLRIADNWPGVQMCGVTSKSNPYVFDSYDLDSLMNDAETFILFDAAHVSNKQYVRVKEKAIERGVRLILLADFPDENFYGSQFSKDYAEDRESVRQDLMSIIIENNMTPVLGDFFEHTLQKI